MCARPKLDRIRSILPTFTAFSVKLQNASSDMDEALAWGRKAVVACRAPVEVREFLGRIQDDNPQIPALGQD